MSAAARWAAFASLYLLGVVATFALNKASPVLTVIGADFGMGLATVGWINSACTVMGMVVAFPAAWIIKKFGSKRALIIAAAALIVGALGGGLASAAPVFLVFRVIEGLGLGLVAVIGPGSIVRLFEADKRGLPMGIWATWVAVGGLFAFFLAPALTAALGWRSLWWFAAGASVVCLVFLAFAFRLPPADVAQDGVPRRGPVPPALKADLRSIVLVAFSFLILNLVVVGAFASFYPTYLQEAAGISVQRAAIITALSNLVTLVVSTVATPWVAKHNAQKATMIVSSFITLAVFGFIAFAAHPSAVTIWVTIIAVGYIAGTIPPTVFLMVPVYAKTPEQTDFAIALTAVFQKAGIMIGAAAFGAVAAATSWSSAGLLFLGPAAALGIVALIFCASIVKTLKQTAEANDELRS